MTTADNDFTHTKSDNIKYIRFTIIFALLLIFFNHQALSLEVLILVFFAAILLLLIGFLRHKSRSIKLSGTEGILLGKRFIPWRTIHSLKYCGWSSDLFRNFTLGMAIRMFVFAPIVIMYKKYHFTITLNGKKLTCYLRSKDNLQVPVLTASETTETVPTLIEFARSADSYLKQPNYRIEDDIMGHLKFLENQKKETRSRLEKRKTPLLYKILFSIFVFTAVILILIFLP